MKNDQPTKANVDYWHRRYEELQLLTEAGQKDYTENLNRQFREATFRIQRKLSRFYEMFAHEEGITLQQARRLLNSEELEEFHMSIEEYVRLLGEYEKNLDPQLFQRLQRASLKYRVTRLEAIELQMMGEVMQAYQSIDIDTFNVVKDAYIERYYRSIFTVFKGYGVGASFSKINEDALRTLLMKPWAPDGTNFSERVWKNRRKLVDTLATELTQALITGNSYTETAERLAKKMNTEINKCTRIVATESAYFSSIAQQNSFEELGVEEYQIVATLDSRTSDICQHQDLKVYKMSEFKPGETAPPFHVRCRTTTCPYFDDSDLPGYIAGERAARDEDTGKTYYVPADMSYPKWKREYVDGNNKTT